MPREIRPVIEVDEEKCVNCHKCISVCPVKYCIDGSGDKVKVVHELCIGCGSCIAACSHGAREGIDDFDAFMSALGRGERMIAFVAPAAAARFPSDYLKLNGWLRSRGVEAIFDVAFGAELTVRSYIEYLKDKAPPLVIAQPCPAIVSYIEIYQPELIPRLAPADSPMLHAMKMVREYRPDLASSRMVFISPCVAKRRELDATGTEAYNVTIRKIEKYLSDAKVDLRGFPDVQFDNPPAERAVLFSSPGGLKETVERELPGIGARIRKIEGPASIYPYLRSLREALAKDANPAIVDCLNCEKGCNGGTGTGSEDMPIDILESRVRSRDRGQRELLAGRGRFRKDGPRALRKSLDRFWKPGLYARSYEDRSSLLKIVRPTTAQFDAIYARMHKSEEKDFLDCAACGYGSCEDMAVAVHNGLNKPENCQHYRQAVLADSKDAIGKMAVSLDRELASSAKLLESAMAALPELDRQRSEQEASLQDSSQKIKSLLVRIGKSSALSAERQAELSRLLSTAANVQGELSASLEAVLALKAQMDAVHDLVADINKVASNTNILSMNASIEAAHAGAAGKGFAVVASEIRALADQAGKSAVQIAKTLAVMSKGMERTVSASEKSGADIRELLEDLDVSGKGTKEVFDSLTAMSAETDGIGKALGSLGAATSGVRETYRRMEESLRHAASEIVDIADLSRENVRKLDEQ
jgi:iron only hydrogenase large subunit-like protein